MVTEYNAQNGAALKRLVNDHGVELREFSEEVVDAFAVASEELYEELAEGDELTGRIVESFKKARTDIGGWLNIADIGYSTQRTRGLEG